MPMKMTDMSCHISTTGIRGRQTLLFLMPRISQKVRKASMSISSHPPLFLLLSLPPSSAHYLSPSLPLNASPPSPSYPSYLPSSLLLSYSSIVNTIRLDIRSHISAFSLPYSHNVCLCLPAFYRFTGPIYKSRLSVALPAGLHGTYADGLTFEQDDIIQVPDCEKLLQFTSCYSTATLRQLLHQVASVQCSYTTLPKLLFTTTRFTAAHCSALHRIALHCTVLYCTVLYCSASCLRWLYFCKPMMRSPPLIRITLASPALHNFALPFYHHDFRTYITPIHYHLSSSFHLSCHLYSLATSIISKFPLLPSPLHLIVVHPSTPLYFI